MPKYLHLDIPKPCHEDWNKMSPEAQGRFCSSCQKTVTDFTRMSDSQLIAFFKNPKPSVCGRFTEEQLERDILIPRKRIPWVKYFFQFTLPAFLWSLKSSAQTGAVRIQYTVQKIVVEKPSKLLGDTIEKKQPSMPVEQLRGYVGGVSYSVKTNRYISGRVTDYEGNPLPGASIMVKGTTKSIVTDDKGYFLLADVRKKLTVIASYAGFEVKEVSVAKTKYVNIRLTPQQLTEEIVVVVAGGIRSTTTYRKAEAPEVCMKPKITLYPNPVQRSSMLNVKWENLEAGNYRLEIYNVAGALMKVEKWRLEKGLKETFVAINELPAANYFLRLSNSKTGEQLSQQFIVRE